VAEGLKRRDSKAKQQQEGSEWGWHISPSLSVIASLYEYLCEGSRRIVYSHTEQKHCANILCYSSSFHTESATTRTTAESWV